jgi:hypothetical protein
LEQVVQVHLRLRQTEETEITLYLGQLLLLAAVVDKVMLLPQVELLPLAVQAVVAAHKMVLVEVQRVVEVIGVVMALMVANSITLRVVVVVRAQLEKLL